MALRPDPSMPSVTRVRVRYKDTDTMSVVYYGNYLTYFEVGRVEYLRQAGLPMSEVDRRLHLPVVEAFVKYHRPARLDDLLEITCRVSERRRASFRFSYEIRNEAGELVATGYTLHACWEPGTGKMIPIPDWLKEIMPDADLDPARR
jgi:acyl-CoA thioester hydrolase